MVWRPPLAQGVILESRDRVLRRATCMEPASPSTCVSASLSLYVFYLFIHDRHREREAETQAEGEAGSMPEA